MRVEKAQEKATVLVSPIDYDNPPTMGAALGSVAGGPGESDARRSSAGQVAAAAGALILGAIVVATTGGGDYGYVDAPAGQAPVASLSPQEREARETRAREFEEALSRDPRDETALEGLAVTVAELGDYPEAERDLERLTQLRPSDADAWRLLGEVRGFQAKYGAAADAYRRSIAESGGAADLEQLQGLAGAPGRGGREAEAVALVKAEVARAGGPGGGPVGAVEARLLLGKVYSQWKGHTGDAANTYDELISASPEDFRGYLAKGVLLRDNGSKGDAQRNFIQARYFAPPEARPIVDKISGK